jgi:hypothetical protein
MKSISSIFMCFILLTLSSVLCAQSDLTGKVKDKISLNPIGFATIVIKNKNVGVYSGVDGSFSITNYEYNKSDSLIISSIGYRTQKICFQYIESGNISVFLAPLITNLDEITVKSKRIKRYKNKELGIDKRKTNDSFSSRISSTYEFAVFIPNARDYDGFFKSIDIYITQFDYNDDPFRLNLYSFDTICRCPGESLLRSSQYITKAKKGWNSISIENQLISLPSTGFFISYERLSLNSNPNLKAQHHSIGWIKGADIETYRTFTRSGGSLWRIDNKFLRKSNVPLVRTKVKII